MTATTDEKSRKCCFGCTDVRKLTRIIAVLNICALVFGSILHIVFVIIVFREQNTIVSTTDKRDEAILHSKRILLSAVFYILLIECMFLYINFCLKKATYEKDVQSIKHWLVMYLMFLIYLVIDFGFVAFLTERPQLVLGGLVWFVVILFFLYVVNCFYREELESSVTISDNSETSHASPSSISIV